MYPEIGRSSVTGTASCDRFGENVEELHRLIEGAIPDPAREFFEVQDFEPPWKGTAPPLAREDSGHEVTPQQPRLGLYEGCRSDHHGQEREPSDRFGTLDTVRAAVLGRQYNRLCNSGNRTGCIPN